MIDIKENDNKRDFEREVDMYNPDVIMEPTRIQGFKITITYDGISVNMKEKAGFAEGWNFRGDGRIIMDTERNNSPIAQEFRKFYNRITRKYFKPKNLKGSAK